MPLPPRNTMNLPRIMASPRRNIALDSCSPPTATMERVGIRLQVVGVLAQGAVQESAATKTAQELRKLLTPPQLAQAEHEIDEWRAAHHPRDSGR